MYSRHIPDIQSMKASINTTRFKRFLRISIPGRTRNLWYRLLHNKISSKTITAFILQLPGDKCLYLDVIDLNVDHYQLLDTYLRLNSFEILSSVFSSIWNTYWRHYSDPCFYDGQVILDEAIKTIRKLSAYKYL
ncbi:uncharacterized protein B0P05DRAFT_541978 [Gilbertella persicaria]|uniref:uncharacterized protein n=1 Tax=Gilbertella persicaria TaxID=101096 RepID=UPI00221F4CF5|nr:uncharacterized protein B0P05DRAFT_541978 [Gilbertella persicaria]KAI8078996.1 hypothetical protein B0P05DRAFT_541978 [Gilbertella persicaria]